jgi:hypothetical protein
VIAMNQMPSPNTAGTAATGPGGQAQPYDPELGSPEAQPGAAGNGAGHPVTADETARLMIAAIRRGDQPGADEALSGYLASGSPAAGGPAGGEAALRDLAVRLAEIAADGS